MKNQNGFIVPLIIVIVAILAVGGGAYLYSQNMFNINSGPNLSPEMTATAYYKNVIDKSNGGTDNDISLDPKYVTERFISDIENLMKANPQGLTYSPILCAQDSPEDSSRFQVEVIENNNSVATLDVQVLSKHISVSMINKNGWKIDKITCPQGLPSSAFSKPAAGINTSITAKQNVSVLTDADFASAVTTDPKAKVLAKGDINGDGYEDAIVQEVQCGASCSISLQVVFNVNNSGVKLYKPTKYENFAPAYMSSSAAKSQISNISIKNGIISLTGKGLACTNPNTEEPCTEEKWNIVRTVTYKFDGNSIVQLSVQ